MSEGFRTYNSILWILCSVLCKKNVYLGQIPTTFNFQRSSYCSKKRWQREAHHSLYVKTGRLNWQFLLMELGMEIFIYCLSVGSVRKMGIINNFDRPKLGRAHSVLYPSSLWDLTIQFSTAYTPQETKFWNEKAVPHFDLLAKTSTIIWWGKKKLYGLHFQTIC